MGIWTGGMGGTLVTREGSLEVTGGDRKNSMGRLTITGGIEASLVRAIMEEGGGTLEVRMVDEDGLEGLGNNLVVQLRGVSLVAMVA